MAELVQHTRPVEGLGATRVLWTPKSNQYQTAPQKGAQGAELFLFDNVSSFQELDTYTIPASQDRFARTERKHEPADWPGQCDDGKWYSGDDDWQQTVEHWRDGYMQEEIAKLASEVEAKAEGLVVNRKRRRRFNGVAGDLDGDRWVNGMHDSAFVDRPRSGARQSPIVNLVFDWGGACGLKAEQIRWSGVAGAALAKALETKGWSVGIYAAVVLTSTTHSKWSFNLTVPVKRPEEPLRVGQVGAQFCHPASFRCRAFRIMESMSWLDLGSGLGMCRTWKHMPKYLTDWYRQSLGGNTMLLEKATSRSEAEQVVAKVLDGIRTPLSVEG